MTQQPKFIWQLRIYCWRSPRGQTSQAWHRNTWGFVIWLLCCCLWETEPSVFCLMTHHRLLLPFRRHQPRTGWALPKRWNKRCAAAAENKSHPGSATGLPIVVLIVIAPPLSWRALTPNVAWICPRLQGRGWDLSGLCSHQNKLLKEPLVCFFSPQNYI